MKILMVLESDFPPDTRVENEILSLAKAGHEVVLACSSLKCESGNFKWDNALVIKQKMPKLIYKSSVAALKFPFYFNYWKKFLTKITKNHHFDVIHLHDLPLAKVVKEITEKFDIKFVLDLHENRPEIMQYYEHVKSFPGKLIININDWRKYQKEYVNLCDKLILITEEAKRYYQSNFGLDKDKIFVVSNYVNLNDFDDYKIETSILEKYRKYFLIVYLGETGSRRGTMDIIEAAEKLKENPDIKFVIIGRSKFQKTLENHVKQNSIHNVEFTGWLPLQKAASYLKAASIGISPLHRNIHHDTTYANKIFQYMAMELPLLVSNCTAQKNIVEENNCGYVFQAENIDDFAAKILDISQNKELSVLGNNARQAVEQKYNTEVMRQQIERVYS